MKRDPQRSEGTCQKGMSVERAIDIIDRMGAVSTAHANPPAVMQDFCRRTLYSFQSWNSALPF